MSERRVRRIVRNRVVTDQSVEAIVIAEDEAWLWLYTSATGYFTALASGWEDVPLPPTVTHRVRVRLDEWHGLAWGGEPNVGHLVRYSDDTVTWEPTVKGGE